MDPRCTCVTSKWSPHRVSKCLFGGNGPILSSMRNVTAQKKASTPQQQPVEHTRSDEIQTARSENSDNGFVHVEHPPEMSRVDAQETTAPANLSDCSNMLGKDVAMVAEQGSQPQEMSGLPAQQSNSRLTTETISSEVGDSAAITSHSSNGANDVNDALKAVVERLGSQLQESSAELTQLALANSTLLEQVKDFSSKEITQNQKIELLTRELENERIRFQALQDQTMSELDQLRVLTESSVDTVSSRSDAMGAVALPGTEVSEPVVAEPLATPLLCEVIESTDALGSEPLSSGASSSSSSNNQQCKCITSWKSPHRVSQCALRRMKGFVSTPISRAFAKPSAPEEPRAAVVATRAPEPAAVVERAMNTTDHDTQVIDPSDSLDMLGLLSVSSIPQDAAGGGDSDGNHGVGPDDEYADNNGVDSNDDEDDSDSDSMNSDDYSEDDGEGTADAAGICPATDNSAPLFEISFPKPLDPICTCVSSFFSRHRVSKCALRNSMNTVVSAPSNLWSAAVNSSESGRCNCPFALVSPHRKSKCLLTMPVRQVKKVSNRKRISQQRQRDRAALQARAELERQKQIVRNKLFLQFTFVVVIACALVATFSCPVILFRALYRFDYTLGNFSRFLFTFCQMLRLVLESVICTLVFIGIFDKVLGYCLGLLLRKKLGGNWNNCSAFNIHFGWIAIRLGLTTCQLEVGEFSFFNPPEFTKHAEFLRVKNLRLVLSSTAVWAYLRKGAHLAIRELSVDGLEINLEEKDSELNFEMALSSISKTNSSINRKQEKVNAKQEKVNAKTERQPLFLEIDRIIIHGVVIHTSNLSSSIMHGDKRINTLIVPLFLLDREELTRPPKEDAVGEGLDLNENGDGRRPNDIKKISSTFVKKMLLILMKTNGATLSVLLMSKGITKLLSFFPAKLLQTKKNQRKRKSKHRSVSTI